VLLNADAEEDEELEQAAEDAFNMSEDDLSLSADSAEDGADFSLDDASMEDLEYFSVDDLNDLKLDDDDLSLN
jgi:DNA-directed RNA polymerase subunit beta